MIITNKILKRTTNIIAKNNKYFIIKTANIKDIIVVIR